MIKTSSHGSSILSSALLAVVPSYLIKKIHSHILQTIIILSIGVFGSSSTFASEASLSEFSRTGFYVGAGGIYALETFSNTHQLKFTNSPGYNFRLGYRFVSFMSWELEGERIEEFGVKGSKEEVKTWAGTLNAKFHFLDGRIQPFVISGMGFLHATTKLPFNVRDNFVAGRGGLGLDAYITKHWLINMEVSYVFPFSSRFDDSIELSYVGFGAGLQMRW